MKSVTATHAKNNFGLLLEDCAESPVAIERHGRVVAYMVAPADFDPAGAGSQARLSAELRRLGATYATVFGSVARGAERFSSDLDLAVSTGARLRPEQRLAMIDAAAQANGRAVDLIDLETAVGLIFSRAMQGREILCDHSNTRQRLIAKLLRTRDDRRVTAIAAARSRSELFR